MTESLPVPPTAVSAAGRLAMHRRRKRLNLLALSLSLAAMAFGVFWLIWILIETVRLGIGGLALSVLTEMTPPPLAASGGLANAIFGSLMMVSLATLLGTPIGVMAGVYLAEYGQKTWLGHGVRFINDILLSAPSIVIGLFIYAVVVAPLRGFSAIAGILSLALIVIPVVIRQTENMLSLVPHSLREAAYALGTPKWKVILSVTLKAAGAGVITGILLAVARIVGEMAPLLFTQPLRELAEAGLGRCLPDHAGRAAAEHPGARAVPPETLTPEGPRWTPCPTCRSPRRPSSRCAGSISITAASWR